MKRYFILTIILLLLPSVGLARGIRWAQLNEDDVLDSLMTDKLGWVDVRAYGAVAGGDSAVNRVSIQNAIDGLASGGGCIYIPPGVFEVDSTLAIADSNITFRGEGIQSQIAWTIAGKVGIHISASGVSMQDVKLYGVQHTSLQISEKGIHVYGADASNFIDDIRIENCFVENWGKDGILLEFVEDFEVVHNKVIDCYEGGIIVLSCHVGKINQNHIKEIIAPGYGIEISAHDGLKSTYPVCYDIEVCSNIVEGCRTWEAIDTHGGHHLSFIGNHIKNALRGITLTYDASEVGNEKAPDYCVVKGNIIERGTLVAADNVHAGIFASGHTDSAVAMVGLVISDNTINGYGDNDCSVGGNGAIEVRTTQGAVVTGNNIQNSGRHGILLRSTEEILVANNVIKTVTGTAPVKATGTITFSTNPSDGDTITINGANYFFVDPAAPATDYEIDVKTTLPLTLDEVVSRLDSTAGAITGNTTDGRVTTATYTEDGDSVLTVTFDTGGVSGNYFLIAASAATTSGANLTGGAVGSSGIYVDYLSGGELCSGVVVNNLIVPGSTYTGIESEDNTHPIEYGPNFFRSVSSEYDIYGSFTGPNSGAPTIRHYSKSTMTYDLPSIAAGSSHTFYMPAPGCLAKVFLPEVMARNRTLTLGLRIETVAGNNYVEVTISNLTSGAIDFANTIWTLLLAK